MECMDTGWYLDNIRKPVYNACLKTCVSLCVTVSEWHWLSRCALRLTVNVTVRLSLVIWCQRTSSTGKIQGDGWKFLDCFKSYFGSQISSQSLNEVPITAKSITKGEFFNIWTSFNDCDDIWPKITFEMVQEFPTVSLDLPKYGCQILGFPLHFCFCLVYKIVKHGTDSDTVTLTAKSH